jgi:hypothetical protein
MAFRFIGSKYRPKRAGQIVAKPLKIQLNVGAEAKSGPKTAACNADGRSP